MFLKSSIIFSSLTFVSRIFGFIRDILIATFFGTGPFADAFNIAFKLPNFFRSIFAEGAFSAAFVPLFSGKLSNDGTKNALKFAGQILSILSISLVILIVFMESLMPQVVTLLAPGFETNPEKFRITIDLTRITTPYLLFISLVTFYSCILNSFNKFAAMAASPIILNIVMILGMYFFGDSQSEKVYIAAWTVFIGGIIQLIVIIMSTLRHDVFPTPHLPKNTQDSKKFFKNMTPAVMSSGVSQLNLWIGTILATAIPGAVSIIYYSDRIIQLPVSLVGVSIGIVILPALSKAFKTKQTQYATNLQNRAIEIATALSLPCLTAILVIAKPLIYTLFQRGEFSINDTDKTVPALIMLSLGIPAYVLNKILVSSFFANENTKTPFRISIVCLFTNTIGNIILIQFFSYVGVCIATSVTAWINLLLLIYYSHKTNIFKFDIVVKVKILRIILSNAFLYIFLYSANKMLDPYLYNHSLSKIAFIGMFAAAIILYLYALSATNTFSLLELKRVHFNKNLK